VNQLEYRVHGVRVERKMPLTPVQGLRPIVFVHGGCHGCWSWVNKWMFFKGKMRGLFSMLFGAGVILLTGRPERLQLLCYAPISGADQRMHIVRKTTAILSLAVGTFAAAPLRGQGNTHPAMTLTVDETQAFRRIAFVHESIHVRPGVLELAYPRWLPGEHGPTGPIQNIAAITVHAGVATLPWVRDPDDINTIKIEVPANTETITVDFDTLLENTISDHQLLLAWNTTVLYPRGIDKRELMIEPSVLLPADWKQGSSLSVVSQTGNRVTFAPTSLERLIDSPVLAGEFFRAVPLASKWPAELDFTGDSQGAIDRADDAHAFALFGKLIDQDQAMFGFRHWKKMHLLVSQSNARPYDGLEHEDSPYNGVGDAGLSRKDQLENFGFGLLAHEQSHSWDGKYRRPAELYSKPDYQGPERTSMLWVYEGLNQYIGMLLATRSGFNDQAYMRDYLGHIASDFALSPGRAATPLVDTATESWVLRSVHGRWGTLRRSQDYYDEGALMWLRADALIREQSHDKVSLDDFLRSFLGQHDTGPVVVPYTRAEVEATLSATWAYDWHTFIDKYVYQVNAQPPTDGLEAAGWHLVYNSTPNNKMFYEDFPRAPTYRAAASLGIELTKDGTIADLIPGTPAYMAGLGPGMVILAVDGYTYSSDALNEAIARPRDGKISLVVRNFDTVQTHEIRYAGGVRHPHLERIPGSHDYLSEILASREDK
jgi:predicted metalloprotease with PDZ domain